MASIVALIGKLSRRRLITKLGWIVAIGALGYFALTRTWSQKADTAAPVEPPQATPVTQEEKRDIDVAELAKTTKFQEAYIMDWYHNPDGGPTMSSEVIELTLSQYQKNNFAYIYADDRKKERENLFPELLERKLIEPVAPPGRKVKVPDLVSGGPPEQGQPIAHAVLTEKGKRLAQDIEYVRKHNLEVTRPIEPEYK
ncbi:MAG: hypothetical protein HZB26_13420 [Candidatus Hydrogenedentes bacterium]|nr:hypothetical protein [Candidatus Hydrogenedentota bacterium]